MMSPQSTRTSSTRRNLTAPPARLLLRLATAVVFTAGLVGVSIAPASAYLSLYDHAGYQGGSWVTSSTNSVSSYNGRYFNNTYRLWDAVSSIKNYNGGWYNFHHDINYGGPYLNVPAGTEYSYVGYGNNDRFSSHY
ncbi:hypothetical protein TSUKUMMB_31910 [Rhodococcus sp. no. 34]